MRLRVSDQLGRVFARVAAGIVVAGAASAASAQTTVTLNQPQTHVVSATVRGGTYADRNNQSLLATRAADNPEYERRALLKFDTQNTIPVGSVVTSAMLTVTVKTGSADATRAVGAFQVRTSFTETEVTWKHRRTAEAWTTAGGDLGSKIATANVGNTTGTKVTFDVTALVKAAVSGSLGASRYTRIALVDEDASTSESYREYFTPSDINTANRPVLKVTYGAASSTTPTTTPSSSSTTLHVLHWNTHHGGVGSDGVWDPYRLTKWIAKLNPDIVSLNEVERFTGWGNTDEPALIASLMKQYTGRTWYYRFQTLAGGSNGIGVMVMSRFPIDASSPKLLVGSRSAIDMAITVNGRTINFSSTHLHPDSSSYRLQEIAEIKSWESGMAEQRIVAGDFNATYTSTENATMKQSYSDSWAVAQANGTAVAYPGNTAGNTRNGRIDFIYYSHGSADLVMKGSQVFDTRDANGVMPSDHRPLMTTFGVK
jgi:endonuclease/exonuclease/phosphatase family metal-dependent hydrolase